MHYAVSHSTIQFLMVALMQASVETLREQVRLLRSQRQRAVVLAHLPALRPEAQTHVHSKGPSQGCAALDVARRLQLEPAQTPKVGTNQALCMPYTAGPVRTYDISHVAQSMLTLTVAFQLYRNKVQCHVCMQVAALIERVVHEVHLLLGDRSTLQQRESLLMDLLTGHSF